MITDIIIDFPAIRKQWKNAGIKIKKRHLKKRIHRKLIKLYKEIHDQAR